MFFWFVGVSFLAAWVVFRDPALDHRLVMMGAVLPDLMDVATGGMWLGHTLAGNVALLFAVMLATTGRRLLRRSLLALPIGSFFHLVLDGVWTGSYSLWWPLPGNELGQLGLLSLERGWWNVPLELAGLAALAWAWRRFRWSEAERRRSFALTGRLGRDLIGA